MKKSLFIVVLTASSLATFGRCDDSSGPFYVLVNQLQRCEDSGTEDVYFESTRINKVAQGRGEFTSNYTLKVPMDEDMKGQVELKAWGNGGWKSVFNYDSPYMCKDLKSLVPEWYDLFRKNTETKKCPFAPGTYMIHSDTLRFDKFNIPQFPFGKYIFSVKFIYRDNLSGCIEMVIDVKAKTKAKKNKG